MTGFPPPADDAGGTPGLAGGMTSPTLARPIAGAALLIAVSLLAGCQAFGINEQYGAEYATLADAEASWDDAHIPDLVPEDATRVRIGYNTIDEGAMLTFVSDGGLTADYCEPDEVDGEPAFEPSWWPEGELPDEGFTCGDWSVVELDGEFVVWN